MSSPYAQKKMIQAARQLMGRIDDRSFAREDAEDWRKDYEVSPLGGFASAGADDVALQLLEHCKDSMTQKQWEDLLFKCALGDTGHNMNILLTECALQLEPKGVARVKSLVRQAFGTGRLSPGWAVVEAEMSRRQMDNSTDMPVSLARTPNRI